MALIDLLEGHQRDRGWTWPKGQLGICLVGFALPGFITQGGEPV